ncbi:MAG TPA: efflux RND transporter periplasmic adaptor subunit [Chryseolinea sp.]|nr:efflux RND transporter periplasmic adaptor subunit [Chryseolinea sp.]
MFFKNSSYSFIVGSFLFISGCSSKSETAMQGPPPVQVVVQQVSIADASYYDEFPVIVRALSEVELRPQVGGYITAMHFKEGDRVKKGQKLYSIDPQQSEGAYQQAMANLSVQETNLVKAQKDVERYRELNKSDAIAKQQVDYAEATFEAAKKQVQAAKATVSSVQTNVRYTTIVAPFDGTIGISAVRLGASVSPGTTLLNTISSDDPIGADISVDQKGIYRFTQLSKNSNKNDSTFRLAFGSDVYPHPGYISIIDRAVDSQTGTIRMRLTFPSPDHALRAGMSGTLQVLSTSKKSVIIPQKAITEQLGEFFVYVADSSKVSQRKVKLGQQLGKSIIVSEGLKEGETIVTEGVQNLREGSAIAVAAPTAAKK